MGIFEDDRGLLRMLQVNLWWKDVASEVAEKVLKREIPQDAVAEIQEDLGLHQLSSGQNWNLQVCGKACLNNLRFSEDLGSVDRVAGTLGPARFHSPQCAQSSNISEIRREG